MGAMWRPRVLPSTDACACAGGFESHLRGQEGFGPQSIGRQTCGQERGRFRNFGTLGWYMRAVGGRSLSGGVEVAAEVVEGMEGEWR